MAGIKKNKEILFNLCKRKAKIECPFKDANGNQWEGFIVKPNKEEHEKIIEHFSKKTQEHKKKLIEDNQDNLLISIQQNSKEQLIEDILTFENSEFLQRLSDAYIDKYDEDGEELNEDNPEHRKIIEKRREDKLNKIREKREKALNGKEEEELHRILLKHTINGMALTFSADDFETAKIFYMIKDSEENRVFDSIEEINRLDPDLIEWFKREISTFEIFKTEEDIKEVAESEPFRSDIPSSKKSKSKSSTK